MLKRLFSFILSLVLMLGSTSYALEGSDSGSGESLPFSPSKISLTTELSIADGYSKTLTAVTSEHMGMANDSVSWSSSNPSVCAVSKPSTSYDRTTQKSTSTATLTAVGTGTCTVTATFGTVSASCKVYVMQTPVVSLDSASFGAVKIKWNSVTYAEGYRVYRSTDGGSWKLLSILSGANTTTYTDRTLDPSDTHRYTVRAYRNSGDTQILSGYDPDGVFVDCQLPVPALVRASDTGNLAIQVEWEQSANAAGYRVYRKTASSNWKNLTTLSGGSTTSYLDRSAEAGVKYTYTIRSYNTANGETVWSGYDAAGVSASLTLSTPRLISASDSKSGGIRVTWEQSTNAIGYRFYRKTASSNWKLLKILSGADTTSYLDRTAQAGVKYTYTVRGYNTANGETVLSKYDAAGVSATLVLDTPRLVNASDTGSGGIRVTWEKSGNATGYRVYHKTGSSGWKRIATISNSDTETWLDKTVQAGAKYSYTVRAFRTVDGTTELSSYDAAGVSATLTLGTPQLDDAEDSANGIRVEWEKARNAEGYRVYRKTASSNWKLLAKVSGANTLSYLDRTAQSGVRYTYTVRAYRTVNGTTEMSSYDSRGVSETLTLERPELERAADTGSGSIRVQWDDSDNAQGYRIYRKTASSNWKHIATVTNPNAESYTDSTVSRGVTYTYTVRAYRTVNGKTELSSYDSRGVSATCSG